MCMQISRDGGLTSTEFCSHYLTSPHQAVDLCIEPVLMTELQGSKCQGGAIKVAHHHKAHKPAPATNSEPSSESDSSATSSNKAESGPAHAG